MSDDRSESTGENVPDRPPMLVLLESLGLYRNLKVGLAVGVTVAAVAYLFRTLELLGPLQDGREYPLVGPDAWFLLLAFVLAVAAAMLMMVALMVREAVRKSRTLADD